MGSARRLAKVMVATSLGALTISAATIGAAASVNGRSDRSLRPAATTPLSWPGGGRFLSDPMVAGTDMIGVGAVRIENGVVIGKTSNFDDAPPEMSLRTFALVDHGGAGQSAVFRFLHPIVQLHAWRRIDVRHTITVVLTAPDGAVHAVELQADGTTAVGDMTGEVFTPTGPSMSAIAGNVAVVDIPASLGVTSQWTVQGLVRVESDQRMHPNNSLNFDTGYLAGTSIVPVGLLTGAAESTLPTVPIVDALITLMGAAGPTYVLPTPSMHPTAVHFEGEGTSLVLVVTLAAPPTAVLANRDSLDIELAEPGIDSLEYPMRIGWFPPQPGEPMRDATAADNSLQGSVPVSVSGNNVSFALGSATLTPRPASTVTGAGASMDQLTGQISVVLSGDETVSSADGQSRFVFADTAAEQPTYPAPVKAADAAVVTLNGPAVTVVRTSTGTTATGSIDPRGAFSAQNDSEYYSGFVDTYGNAYVYDASIGAGPDGSVPTLASVDVTGDYDASAVAAALTSPVLIGQTSLKGDLDNPPVLQPYSAPVDRPWTERVRTATASDPAATQPAGTGDWPLTAASSAPVTGLVGPTGPFAVHVSADAVTDGPLVQLGGPWLSSTDIPALSTPAPTVDTTIAPNTTTLASAASPATSAATESAASIAPPAASTPLDRTTSSDGSSPVPWTVLVVAVLAAGATGAVSVSRRRRRGGSPPAGVLASASQIRSVAGTVHSTASPNDDGHELGLQSDRGVPVYGAQESHESSDAIGAR